MKRNNVNVREVRTFAATELRTVSEPDGKKYLEGYAARYNVRSSDLGWGMYEELMPGAFTRALAEAQDVRHLVNHDPSQLLGRTKSGTTNLSEDQQGLRFRTLLPDTQLARDLQESVNRGDINECSFGFICRKATWLEEKDPEGKDVDVRQVQDLDLFDISIVTYPAYPQTNAKLAMRTMFPEGVPTEILDKRKSDEGLAADDADEDMVDCECTCPDCENGNCELCSNEYCCEEMCLHGYPANNRAERADKKKTKRVDGEDLSAADFLIVGDPEDTSTWKLPVHFSTEEKTVNHIKNALARFGQMKDVSESEKKAAWAKLEKLAEEHGIKVSQEDKDKHRSEPSAAETAVLEAQAALALAAYKMRLVEATL